MIIKNYTCVVCGKEYPPEQTLYTCPDDGGNLSIILDYAALSKKVRPKDISESREISIWRYQALLPVADPGFNYSPLHKVGYTPIYQSARLSSALGLKQLWFKDESGNPSASFKDRASAVALARAKEIGAEVIVTASTGNAGAATACLAAAMNMPAIILAPRNAPPAKIAQLLVFGARVILVDGSYDDAFDLSIAATKAFGWYNRNTGYNPFTTEGKKTAAFEIWEQLILKQLPENEPLNLFIPVGDGNIISGIYKGFYDLYQLGWIKKMPRLFGVQSQGSAAIANAFTVGTDTITPVNANTIADSISVNYPRDGLRALRAVRESGGAYITIPDEAILQAIPKLGSAGIFAEPAAAAAYAGLESALTQQLINPAEPILVVITGSGLKDVNACMRSIPHAPIIEPTLQALEKVIF